MEYEKTLNLTFYCDYERLICDFELEKLCFEI